MAIRQSSATTFQLPALLAQDVIIALEWDAPASGTLQGCRLTEAPGGTARTVADVRLNSDALKFTFHLSKGTVLTPPLTAELVITPAPSQPVAETIKFASGVIPEREAIATVYSELNQELRRMRTLYESYLVVVTGGFATLVSKADAIVGAPHRGWMGGVLLLLAGIVSYLMWHVGNRYNRTSASIKNLEAALGLRDGATPWPLVVDAVGGTAGESWWRVWKRFRPNDPFRHVTWAGLLIAYTLALGGLALLFLVQAKGPDPSARAGPGQIVQSIQQVVAAPRTEDSKAVVTPPGAGSPRPSGRKKP